MLHYSEGYENRSSHEWIYWQKWDPPSPVKAVTCLVHGLGEHSGRYNHVAQVLGDCQIAMHTFDLPGHGKSSGKRGHIQSYNLVMEFISSLIHQAKSAYPGIPVFLYGHSLGGNICLYYLLHNPNQVDGSIASAPALAPRTPISPPKRFLAEILYHTAPSFTLPNGLDFRLLSRDSRIIENYIKDPLVHDRVSARLGLDLILNGQTIQNEAHHLSTPLLVIQGTEDRLIDPEENFQLENKIRGDVTVLRWDGGYHEMHNELNKGEVFEQITRWIFAHSQAAG